ncbi:MAG: hypothetical protein IKR15_06495, partial [Bacteroidales bacterium]|nr:hypothetical protein [Bacteroidales bacterium]
MVPHKRTILSVFVALMTFAACQQESPEVNSRLSDLEKRVSALEELCQTMNGNISSLQSIVTAMQTGDYITSVTPLTEGGATIGYTITFAKGDPIIVYYGKDGQDGKDGADGQNGQDGLNGQDGKDGHTPVIGVKQDTDGIWYWTLDGDWLLDSNNQKVKAVGVDGKDGKDGEDGQDGANGQNGLNGQDGKDGKDGTNGQDGITPQLKIEEGYWYVSTDNGQTWTQLGKATGADGLNGKDGIDGKDGKDGKDGDPMFANIDISNRDYVVFTLTNGIVITIPTWYAFEQLRTLVNQVNSNVGSLQTIVTALQDNDYVTSVLPIAEGG